jgi:hypothetical protein
MAAAATTPKTFLMTVPLTVRVASLRRPPPVPPRWRSSRPSVSLAGAWRQGPDGPIEHGRCGPTGPIQRQEAGLRLDLLQGWNKLAMLPVTGSRS